MQDRQNISASLRHARRGSALRAVLGVLLTLWTASAAAAEEITGLAAVPQPAGVSSKLSARLLSLLPPALTKAGFVLLDPRVIDIKLADRPDLLMGCEQERCLVAQAQLLGVPRLLVPRLTPLGRGALQLELILYKSEGGVPPTLGRLAAVTEPCEACAQETLHDAVGRAAVALRRALSVPMQITTAPAGARLVVDGKEVGVAPKEIYLEPGEHSIIADSEKGRAERRVTLHAGQPQTLHLVTDPLLLIEPAPAAVKVAAPRGRGMAIAKWTLAGVGVLAVAAGAAMLAFDDKMACTLPAGKLQCPNLYDTRLGGIGLMAGGGTALVTSAVLFGLDYRAGRAEQGEKVAVLTLGGRF